MYPNLKAEMARKNIKPADIAQVMGISYETITNKLSGRTHIYAQEMFKIRDIFFKDFDLDYLFEIKKNK